MTAQPMLIRGGVAYPITAEQHALARACKPIGFVAGLTSPRAAAPPRQEPAPPPRSDSRGASRAAMLAAIGSKYGADACATAEAKLGRHHGVDPKVATIGTPQPAARRASSAREKGPDGLTMGQRSMLGAIERVQGKAARAKAEARLGVRPA